MKTEEVEGKVLVVALALVLFLREEAVSPRMWSLFLFHLSQRRR